MVDAVSKLKTSKTKVQETETIARTKLVTSTCVEMTYDDVVEACRAWAAQKFPDQPGLKTAPVEFDVTGGGEYDDYPASLNGASLVVEVREEIKKETRSRS